MFNLSDQIGIKSYSLRHIPDNRDVALAVKHCQASAVDLSGCHVDYDDPLSQERALSAYADAGLRISGIGVVGLRNDEAFNRRYFEFARKAGCGVVSCSVPPRDHQAILDLADRLCGEYGMSLAIHNHGGKDWLGNSTILQYLLADRPRHLGLCLDTAWCLQAGENPLVWLDLFGDRLHGVHFKDFSFSPAGQPRDTIVGEGALDLEGFLKKFTTLPFAGSAVIEYEGEDAVEKSRQCVQAVRHCLAGMNQAD